MRTLIALVAVVPAVLAQVPEARPSFEIADVHASGPSRYPTMRASMRVSRYEIRFATMTDLVAAAYGVEPDKVLGGPNWLDTDRYDVIAKMAPNASPQTIRLMLRSLLAERFSLAIHPDQRPAPASVLSVGNSKPKLRESDVSASPGCQRQPQEAGSGAIPAVCQGITMEAFAHQLRAAAGAYVTNPVIDETKLVGAWDFTIKWTPRNRLAAAGSEGITIFDAIDKQLGLKLEAKQVTAPIIVVDRVNERPTPNGPDVNTLLPPLPAPQLEVATIKPTDPQFQGVRIQTPPSGLVNIQGLTLGYLIQTIWFVTPEMIVGAPKWLDTERWDISAKVASTPGSAPQTDMDSMMAMVRALLEDRFKLKTHIEKRVAPVLTLTAARPKLRKGDPAIRSGCKEGPGAEGKDPRLTSPANSRLVTCRNVTMAQFAAQLPIFANALNHLNGPIRSPVVDATGLVGAWDFSLSFAPALGATPNALSATPGENGPAAPTGALSLAEAIGRQLGLKLAVEKRATDVLIIDHIEPKPTDN